MSTQDEPTESALVAYLAATAEQLDIASEDAEFALGEILETFESAANCMESLEAALNAEGEFDRSALLEVAVKMRQMLRTSVVELQFQDRLAQRLAMASRELRQVAADNSIAGFEVPTSDLRVPRSVSSLYNQQQMVRIVRAAGSHTDLIEKSDNPSEQENDIELF